MPSFYFCIIMVFSHVFSAKFCFTHPIFHCIDSNLNWYPWRFLNLLISYPFFPCNFVSFLAICRVVLVFNYPAGIYLELGYYSHRRNLLAAGSDSGFKISCLNRADNSCQTYLDFLVSRIPRVWKDETFRIAFSIDLQSRANVHSF